ncbi:hypothetical protein ACUIAC_01035 [Dermabacteraceae bacterium P13138]|nr:hypothetical protein [Dermabacteraceae bacterium TAE3-ERU27]
MKVKMNRKGMRALRSDPAFRADLLRRAEAIKQDASDNGRVEGYVITDLVLEEPRAAVSIMATGHAARSNRKRNSLVRALDAGRA